MPGGHRHVTTGWASWYCQVWSLPLSCPYASWVGSVERDPGWVWFPVKKPFWMEMRIFLSGMLCGGSAAVRTRWAQPAEHSGMKTSRFPCHCLGWCGVWALGTRGLALPAGCLRLPLAKAQRPCQVKGSWKMQLMSFFPGTPRSLWFGSRLRQGAQ